MNTDDLRNMLHEQNPEGLDGEEMLHVAQRARRHRRMGGAALGVAAAVTAVAVAFGSGALSGPDRADIGSAGPATSSRAITSPATTSPVNTSSATTSPLSTAPATMTTASKVTGLCAPTNAIAKQRSEPGVVAVGPGGDLVVTSDGPNATVTIGGTTTTILTLPEAQGVATAGTDGRFVMVVVLLVANSGETGKQVYLWDSQQGGQAVAFMDTDDDVDVQVVNGHALVTRTADTGTTRMTLMDLGTGQSSEVYSGQTAMAFLTTGGTYLIVANGIHGPELSGTAPYPPTPSVKGEVLMFANVATNGRAWAFYDTDDPGNGSMVIWNPASMVDPIVVHRLGNTSPTPQIGTGYALFNEMGTTWHLVDLRTGARLKLPSSEFTQYTLTTDDVLIRDALDKRSAGPEPVVTQGWVDLSETTLSC